MRGFEKYSENFYENELQSTIFRIKIDAKNFTRYFGNVVNNIYY